jgi:hypothetical protein
MNDGKFFYGSRRLKVVIKRNSFRSVSRKTYFIFHRYSRYNEFKNEANECIPTVEKAREHTSPLDCSMTGRSPARIPDSK